MLHIHSSVLHLHKLGSTHPVVSLASRAEYVVAVGHETGRVQLFDVRRVLSFLTVQDPVADDLRQVRPTVLVPSSVPSSVSSFLRSGGVGRIEGIGVTA